MPPEIALKRASLALPAIPAAWQLPLRNLALAWLTLIVLFGSDWLDMVRQWWAISTYNHILLVPLIIGWLVAQRRGELAKLPPQAWWPGLVVVGGAALVWVLGSFAGLSIARQLGAVVMLQGVALTLLGTRVSTALLFPLAYMVFLVPLGEELVPALQVLTAHMTMALLGWSNLPAMLDGVFITTPTGYFEVAEACSGVKFLIAMVAYGALVGNVCFQSWARRAAFMALCVGMPILANGVRAWGTIIIAHHRGIEFASGFDHIFYGWVFFAIVIALVMAIGWKLFDRAIDDPMIDADRIAASPGLAKLSALKIASPAALGAIAAIVLLALGWSAAAATMQAPVPAQVTLPQVPGWTRVDYTPKVWWEPRQRGADHRLLGRYRNAQGKTVDVSYALYSAQEDGREAGGFGQGALMPDSEWAWREAGSSLQGSHADWLQAPGEQRLALTWYRTGELLTGSNLSLKLANITDRLLLRPRTTATLIVSATDGADHPATRTVAEFVAATGPVSSWMDRIGQGG